MQKERSDADTRGEGEKKEGIRAEGKIKGRKTGFICITFILNSYIVTKKYQSFSKAMKLFLDRL